MSSTKCTHPYGVLVCAVEIKNMQTLFVWPQKNVCVCVCVKVTNKCMVICLASIMGQGV